MIIKFAVKTPLSQIYITNDTTIIKPNSFTYDVNRCEKIIGEYSHHHQSPAISSQSSWCQGAFPRSEGQQSSLKIIIITNIIILLVPGSIPKIRGSITTSLFTSHQRKKAAPSSKPTFLDSNLTENQTSESIHRNITIVQIILLTILYKVYVLTQTNFPSKGGPRIGSRVLYNYHDHPDHNTHHLIQGI